MFCSINAVQRRRAIDGSGFRNTIPKDRFVRGLIRNRSGAACCDSAATVGSW
jgi:hypothetical protein